MTKWAGWLLLVGFLGVVRPIVAVSCPTPAAFVIPSGGLPATKAAIERRTLTMLNLGGAATLGGPAGGAEYTYPSRLAARLTKAVPGLSVKIVMLAVPRQSSADLDAKLTTALANSKPGLVIWGTGASAAGRGDDLETFIGDITGTIARIRSSGADLILMTLQYAPSVARVINLSPYRAAVMRAGEMADVPVLDRYELMRFWSDNGYLDLDATKIEDRVQVARKLYECMAEILTKEIIDAIR